MAPHPMLASSKVRGWEEVRVLENPLWSGAYWVRVMGRIVMVGIGGLGMSGSGCVEKRAMRVRRAWYLGVGSPHSLIGAS